MRKWEELAQKTFDDIKKRKKQEKKQADRDYNAVVIDNIYRIKKRIGRG